MKAPVAHLWTRPDGGDPAFLAVGSGRCGAVVHKAPTRDEGEPGQDAAAAVSWDGEACALLVADGVGGHGDGAMASRLAISCLVDRLRTTPPEGLAIQAAVLAAIEEANVRLLEMPGGSATTVLVTVLVNGELRTYHAGDSELLLVGQRGKIKHQTISHSPVGYAVEAGVLDQQEGFEHEDRHLLTNCVGMAGMRIEVASAIRMAARDTLVLASDGLWDNLYVDEVVDIVRAGPLPAAVDELVRRCASRMAGDDERVAGKPDDLSIVVFRPF